MEEEGANSRSNFCQPGEDDAARSANLGRSRPSGTLGRSRPSEGRSRPKEGRARVNGVSVQACERANKLKKKALKQSNELLISLGRSDLSSTSFYELRPMLGRGEELRPMLGRGSEIRPMLGR